MNSIEEFLKCSSIEYQYNTVNAGATRGASIHTTYFRFFNFYDNCILAKFDLQNSVASLNSRKVTQNMFYYAARYVFI